MYNYAQLRLAQACQANSGALLPFVGTPSAARDMDVLRAGLGESRMTYLGFSYGTLLGATYANLFPARVRAMVLDGAETPRRRRRSSRGPVGRLRRGLRVLRA